MLMPAMKTKRFNKFSLDRNEFPVVRDGINFAIECIESNTKLKEFQWTENPILRRCDATDLLISIQSHPSIVRVNLSGTFAEFGYRAMCSIIGLVDGLERLTMDSNNIRTMNDTRLSDFIARNPPLSELSLVNNHLNDGDAILIARALKDNDHLAALGLGQNDFSAVGIESLVKAIYNHQSFKSVVGSNHVCRILGFGFTHDSILNNIHTKSSLPHPWCRNDKRNLDEKIDHFLNEMTSQGCIIPQLNCEFGEDYLKLVPAVLSSIAQCGLFSCVFEVIRGWKMPGLFDIRRNHVGQ
ncbi:hypothetical protein ACHAWF_009227 [Thalassiosira exigua]